MSTERIVVDSATADTFVQTFAARAKELTCGDPAAGAGDCVVGPMVNASSGPRLNSMIDDAVAKGANLVAGAKANGAVMPATILDHVTPDMQIFDDETFGPITTVVRAKNTEDAVELNTPLVLEERVVTRLSQFRFRSRLKTWVYRLAVNYFLDVKIQLRSSGHVCAAESPFRRHQRRRWRGGRIAVGSARRSGTTRCDRRSRLSNHGGFGAIDSEVATHH